MKSISTAMVLAILCFASCGCRARRPYLIDRWRDASDIVTVAAGKGYGAKIRTGPVHVGAFFNRDRMGLRGGESHREWSSKKALPSTFDFDMTFISGERFDPERFVRARNRHKCFVASGAMALSFSKGIEGEDWSVGDASYYTQAEVAAGLWWTLRLGINPGEALDFLLGWLRIDLFDDDVNRPGRRPPRKNRKTKVRNQRTEGPSTASLNSTLSPNHSPARRSPRATPWS